MNHCDNGTKTGCCVNGVIFLQWMNWSRVSISAPQVSDFSIHIHIYIYISSLENNEFSRSVGVLFEEGNGTNHGTWHFWIMIHPAK